MKFIRCLTHRREVVYLKISEIIKVEEVEDAPFNFYISIRDSYNGAVEVVEAYPSSDVINSARKFVEYLEKEES